MAPIRPATAALLLVGAACATEPPPPDGMLGEYRGNFAVAVSRVFSPSFAPATALCPGVVTLTEQTAAALTGTFRLYGSTLCQPSDGVVEGVSLVGDSLILAFYDPESAPTDLFPAFGCRPIAGEADFAGALARDHIELTTWFHAYCFDTDLGFTVRTRWDVVFRGDR